LGIWYRIVMDITLISNWLGSLLLVFGILFQSTEQHGQHGQHGGQQGHRMDSRHVQDRE